MRKFIRHVLPIICILYLGGCGPELDNSVVPNKNGAESKPTPPNKNQLDTAYNFYEHFKHTFVVLNKLSQSQQPTLGQSYSDPYDYLKKIKENCDIQVSSTGKPLERLLIGASYSVVDRPTTPTCPFNYQQNVNVSEDKFVHGSLQYISGTASLSFNKTPWKQFLKSMILASNETSKHTLWSTSKSGSSNVYESIQGDITDINDLHAFIKYKSKIYYEWENNQTINVVAKIEYLVRLKTTDPFITISEKHFMQKDGSLVLKILLNDQLVKTVTYLPSVMYIHNNTNI